MPAAPSAIIVPADELANLPSETLVGPQARDDARSYKVWQKQDNVELNAGRYLVDDAGKPVYFVDPGINGTERTRPDGSPVPKFDAPKATLISYIIKGILNQELPWSLVILGVMIAVVLEMIGVPSLAFAVGVYLPLSTTPPMMVGGTIRWFVDRRMRRNLAQHELTEAELIAEADRGPGVLLASGYIAGGAIAGIGIAFLAGVLSDTDTAIHHFMTANNPFFVGPYANVLSMIPFIALSAWLLIVAGRKANG
jgi:hypothetical protein